MGEGTTHFFHSQDCSDSDTLTRKLTSMLQEQILPLVERLFGSCDSNYVFLGIEFNQHGPSIWYPIKGLPLITIWLSETARNNFRQALFQLAQETVHLLSPTGDSNANNLEEGVSIWFSNYYLTSSGYEEMPINMESYKQALKLVKPFLDKDPCLVKRIRDKQPSFHKMTVEDIRPEFAGLSEEELEFLVAKFQRESDSTANT